MPGAISIVVMLASTRTVKTGFPSQARGDGVADPI
jgi:hypothetical protein